MLRSNPVNTNTERWGGVIEVSVLNNIVPRVLSYLLLRIGEPENLGTRLRTKGVFVLSRLNRGKRNNCSRSSEKENVRAFSPGTKKTVYKNEVSVVSGCP